MIQTSSKSISRSYKPSTNFFEYWDALGFFDNLATMLPREFLTIFEIARVVFTPETVSDALTAIEELSREERMKAPNRDESILINRKEISSPLSDTMEIAFFKTIYDLKKSLPRELAQEDDIFDIKLLTKTLQVQKFYKSEYDQYKPITTSRDETGKTANRFEQKVYLLLDRSRSMDLKMRSFFSKCLVAEFLRRKMNTNAMIFFRSFDSDVGDLHRLGEKEDFPLLIEKVLLTTTGGRSTNLQFAIEQAIEDIKRDKDIMRSEILVVTDGISKIDRFKILRLLGDIKLNILKIGQDLAEPNFIDKEFTLQRKYAAAEPSQLSINDIRKKLSDAERGSAHLNAHEKRGLRYLLEISEQMLNDLKEVAYRFIELRDLKQEDLFKVTDETLDFIITAVDEFERIDLERLSIDELKRLYKQAYFLNQYLELLLELSENRKNPHLQNAHERLQQIRERLLHEPTLYDMVTRARLDEEKEILKLARKEVKKKRKEISRSRPLTAEEIKRAQLMLTMNAGEGTPGQLLRVLLLKLWEALKNLFTR